MARPRLGEEERRTRTVGVRVTEAEAEELQERAQAARLSMGAYLRRRGLGQRVRTTTERRLGAAELRAGSDPGGPGRVGRTGAGAGGLAAGRGARGLGAASEAARRDGLSVRYRYRSEDWYRLTSSVSEERMEQVREFDGEQAYEKMRRAMEKASQERARQVERSSKLPARKRPERRGPERGGPERDYGPSR